MNLKHNFGDAVILNGSPSQIHIIVAKRKINFKERK